MAVTSLSQAINDALKAQRIGMEVSPTATMRSGLVSDLAAGDFVWGARAYVVSTGATSGSPSSRVLTLRRRGELQFDVSWHAASTVWFLR
jgi:hypothetical protein